MLSLDKKKKKIDIALIDLTNKLFLKEKKIRRVYFSFSFSLSLLQDFKTVLKKLEDINLS